MTTITATNIIYTESLTAKAKAIYTYLAYRSNKENTCFPGLKRMAKECALSVSSVQRAITELMEHGLVIKKPNYRKDGSQTSNIYVLIEHLEKRAEAKKENLERKLRQLRKLENSRREKQLAFEDVKEDEDIKITEIIDLTAVQVAGNMDSCSAYGVEPKFGAASHEKTKQSKILNSTKIKIVTDTIYKKVISLELNLLNKLKNQIYPLKKL